MYVCKRRQNWNQTIALRARILEQLSACLHAPAVLIIEGKLDDKGQVLQKQIPTTVVGLFIGEDQREWQPYVKPDEIPNPLYVPK